MADPDVENENQVAFLENEPPPLFARGLSLLLIALFVAAVVLSSIIHLPETVTATFQLVPVRGTDPIRAPRAGSLIDVHAVESARVKKGAVLFHLRSADDADRSAELRTEEARERSATEGLANARRKYQSESLSAAEEMKQLVEKSAYLDRMLVLKKQQLDLTLEQAERARTLHKQGLASLDMASDVEIRHSQTAMEMEELRADRRETSSAMTKLRHSDEVRQSAFREQERELVAKVGEARNRIAALSVSSSGTDEGEVEIAAPCDGTILRLAVRSGGTFVAEGDKLTEIACSGEKLQAELTLPQGGLSRIRPGQPVRLLYEAFPYQRFGVKNGIVSWSSPAGAPGEKEQTFRAFAQLVETRVRVDGEDRLFLPGMKGSALVVVGRRSVISYAFDPLRQMREALR